jgi:hypothetical protein
MAVETNRDRGGYFFDSRGIGFLTVKIESLKGNKSKIKILWHKQCEDVCFWTVEAILTVEAWVFELSKVSINTMSRQIKTPK